MGKTTLLQTSCHSFWIEYSSRLWSCCVCEKSTLWPSLNDEILNQQPKSKHPTRTLQPLIDKLPPPELIKSWWKSPILMGCKVRFAITESLPGSYSDLHTWWYPSKVLWLGPENKDEYTVGKIHKCSLLPCGLVHAVVNRIWGRSCKIACKKLGDSSFMFHIRHQPTRQWVIQRGIWHIDDCLLFVLSWTPKGSFKVHEIYTLLVWVN